MSPVELSTPIAIDRIAAGGDGVGRLADGRVVFVPKTAPGDVAKIEITREHARFVRGRVRELEQPSPARAEPPCAHYRRDDCGGCQLQHLTPAAQAEALSGIAGDALRRIGKLDVANPSLELAEKRLSYRTRLTLSRGRGLQFGFHRRARAGEVFDLDRCEIAREPINDLWRDLRAERRRLPPNTDRLGLRLDRHGGEHVIVETAAGGQAWAGARDLHTALARNRSLTVWWQPEGGAARALAGSPDPYPAAIFEQVHPEMASRVREVALEALGGVGGLHAWDLYSGIGESALVLAARGATVESVEIDSRAVREAHRAAKSAGLDVTLHEGRVEDLVERMQPPDVIVTNPPRAGMPPSVLQAFRARAPRRIVYVSCDPATLARDLALLTAEHTFRLAFVRAFDLFPQTAHVESVAVLERP